ncbi:amino acid ABC transporter substrate-binding protein [Acidovorax sp. sif1233]|uniref:amino acid ABC transporter substrate-binding protein n=1 Tax=unclassified Acidovorax TaxID=2684926 RepID=UPI001C4512BB|nr:amino acid ABC transporter substrate-binding protein [Acidovorax sp. sif1233]MBV7457569.1 amino acid ABC transporter substrate-binding protein [Acidovorax sp. sif1233]
MKTSLGQIAAVGATALAALLAAPAAHAGKTLDGIRARGQVVCGVNTGLAGFAIADSSGRWSGLDVDICRALAAAVLGDGQKVKYVPLDVPQRFTALQSGEVDVLSRNTTFSLARDASLGLHQTAVTYYDGQGFIVPARSKIKNLRQLKGQTVCVQSGTTTEKNLADYSRAHDLDIKPVMFEKVDAATSAYLSGRCSAFTTDASGLASLRSGVPQGAATHTILPELISKEPLGPMVRRGDDEWFAVVKWVIYGLIEAEEQGVTQANADQLKTSSSHPAVQRMLGTSEDTGKLLGLDRDWLLRAVRTTGNYGEIFERNVGQKSALALPRGLNNLWNRQGLMYAFPIR